MGTQLPENGTTPIFGPCLLWRNGCCCMYQDTTWYSGRPQPRRHSVRWGRFHIPKKGHSSPLLFGPCLLWPNGRPSQLLLSCLHSKTYRYRYRLHVWTDNAGIQNAGPSKLQEWKRASTLHFLKKRCICLKYVVRVARWCNGYRWTCDQ